MSRRGQLLSRRLPWLAAAALGVLSGLGSFTFGYGEGASYLSDDPASCANCHVMQEHYDSWIQSSHHAAATCNDCHLGHDFVGKWYSKADNGFFHSLAFTTGNFPDPLQIKHRNRELTQAACVRCHRDYVDALLPTRAGGGTLYCVHCHAAVGHARRGTTYTLTRSR